MSALAHPSSVSFKGSISSLIGFTISPGSASATDVTSFESAIVRDSGGDARIVRDYTCLAIDSGSATVRMLGGVGYSRDDIGTESVLSVSTPGGSGSWRAILASWELEGSVGDLIKGSAEFIIIGN